MLRTGTTSVRMLQAVSLVVSLAVLLWTLGLPALNVVLAVSLTDVSDTLSDSDRSTPSNHTITFETSTGVANGEDIVITFPAGFDMDSIDFTDVDVAAPADLSVAIDCSGAEEVGATTSAQVLTLTLCSGDGATVASSSVVTIEIGTHASFGTTGDQQIINHADAGSYELNIDAGLSDSGATQIVILDDVVVTAAVDTIFDFTVAGFAASGIDVNGTTTNATSTATAIPFGTLTANNIKTAAQRLNVSTNATNGFVVTVFQSGDLASVTGADINSFVNGSYDDVPDTWEAPAATIGNNQTYGHWGLTSSDDLNANEFGTNLWVAASTTPRQVFSATSSADGLTANIGSTTVGYQVEISALQEAADDYSTTLTYVATPTF